MGTREDVKTHDGVISSAFQVNLCTACMIDRHRIKLLNPVPSHLEYKRGWVGRRVSLTTLTPLDIMNRLEKYEISNEFLKSRTREPRIVKTEGFERLFSHYTGLEGEELITYLQEFQAKALAVYTNSLGR